MIMGWRNDWDVSDIKHITVHEDSSLSFSSVLNVYGEPYTLTRQKDPIGFNLTKKKEPTNVGQS